MLDIKFIRALLVFFLFINFSILKADTKKNIIENINQTDSIKFDFIQITNDKEERGICYLKRPYYLKCEYKDKNQKQLIVNRNRLVIYHKRYEKIYNYPLSKSYFTEILSKEKFSEIKSTFHPKLYEKYKKSGSTDKSSIFILGMPRSGTTLLEQILSNHSKIFGADEQEFIPKLLQKKFGNHKLSLFFENIVPFDEKDLKNQGDEYIKKMKEISNDSERFTDKLPENFLWIGYIKLILPHSKIIHCYRNPEDICLSIFKNHFPSGKIKYSYDFMII